MVESIWEGGIEVINIVNVVIINVNVSNNINVNVCIDQGGGAPALR